MDLFDFADELVEQELCVSRAAGCLRMELHGAEWLRLVADALVCAVVHIYEPWLPVAAQS